MTKTKLNKKKPLKLFNISHKLHKWLMLFIGVQFVIWSVTGAYMVFFDIDYIHGDSLVHTHQQKINPKNLTYSSKALFERYPAANNLSVGLLVDVEVYRFNVGKRQYIINARTGEQLSPITKKHANTIATHAYTGDGTITNTQLISRTPPFSVSPRHLPVWQVDFDHFSAPTLFIAANNGKVVVKRHQFWYLFDWMFRFHIMDYGDEQDPNNWLLFFIAIFALIATLSGLVLTYFKVIKAKLRKNKQKQQADKRSVGEQL